MVALETDRAELVEMLERTVDMLHECGLRDEAYALLNRVYGWRP